MVPGSSDTELVLGDDCVVDGLPPVAHDVAIKASTTSTAKRPVLLLSIHSSIVRGAGMANRPLCSMPNV